MLLPAAVAPKVSVTAMSLSTAIVAAGSVCGVGVALSANAVRVEVSFHPALVPVGSSTPTVKMPVAVLALRPSRVTAEKLKAPGAVRVRVPPVIVAVPVAALAVEPLTIKAAANSAATIKLATSLLIFLIELRCVIEDEKSFHVAFAAKLKL